MSLARGDWLRVLTPCMVRELGKTLLERRTQLWNWVDRLVAEEMSFVITLHVRSLRLKWGLSRLWNKPAAWPEVMLIYVSSVILKIRTVDAEVWYQRKVGGVFSPCIFHQLSGVKIQLVTLDRMWYFLKIVMVRVSTSWLLTPITTL